VTGGLDLEMAESIHQAWAGQDPHCAAAEMWEAYAATLPPSPNVAAVSTGVQSVSYSPPMPGGDYGAALARAEWHRSFCRGELISVPTRAVTIEDVELPAGIIWDVEPQ